jgi:hypothetical protein
MLLMKLQGGQIMELNNVWISTTKLVLWGVLSLGIIGTVTGFYIERQNMKIDLQEANELITAKDFIIEEQNKVAEQMENDFILQKEINETLRADKKKSQKIITDLENKFDKTSKLLGERDIGSLASRKPKAVEKVINNGTKDMIRCFEIASGAELTEDEKNAEKLSQLNNICPSIANPSARIN